MSGYTIKAGNAKLIIEIDASQAAMKSAKPSQSGKNRLLASTHGFQAVALPDGTQVRLSLNATLPND